MKKYIIAGFGIAIAGLFMIYSVGHADIVGSIKGIAGGIASKTQETARDSSKKILEQTTETLKKDLKETGQTIAQDTYSLVNRPLGQIGKSDFFNYLLAQMSLNDKNETCKQGGACRALEALGCRTSKNFVSICSLICHDHPGFNSSSCIKQAQSRFGFDPNTQAYTNSDGKTELNKDHIVRQIAIPQAQKTTHDVKFWNDFCRTSHALIPSEHRAEIANACRVAYGQPSSEESPSHDRNLPQDETRLETSQPSEPIMQEPQGPSSQPSEPIMQEPQGPSSQPSEPIMQEPQGPSSQPSEPIMQEPQEPSSSIRPTRPQRPGRLTRPVRPALNPEVIMDRMMLDIEAKSSADFCQKCPDRSVCSNKLVYSLCAASCADNLPTCTSTQTETLGFTPANSNILLSQVSNYLADKIYDDNPQSTDAPLSPKEEKLLTNYCTVSRSFMQDSPELNDAQVACQLWLEILSTAS